MIYQVMFRIYECSENLRTHSLKRCLRVVSSLIALTFVFLGSLLIQFLSFSAYLALAKNNSAWGKYQQVSSVKA